MEKKNDKNQNHEKNSELCNRLFVYGTLQNGQSRNYILSGLKYKQAILPNHRKVTPLSLGFPIILWDDVSEVKGELYFGVNQNLMKQIDMIEGEGSLYNRILVKVKIDGEKELEAFTYYPFEILIKNYK